MTKQRLPEGMTKRGRVYWADFRANGRRVRKSLSGNLKTARELLIELRARAERGDYGLLDNNVLVDTLKAEYLKHCRQTSKPNTVERYEGNLAAILPHMPRKVSAVTIQRVMTYREERLAAGISPATINMDVTVLGGMFNWGVRHQLIGSNPLKGVGRLPHDRPKEGRALADSEVKALLDNSPQRYSDIWYVLLVTGVRITELASLRFADIDWEARELIVQRGVAKSHKARRIPIDNALWEIVSQMREGRDDQNRVFLNSHGGPLSRHPVYQVFHEVLPSGGHTDAHGGHRGARGRSRRRPLPPPDVRHQPDRQPDGPQNGSRADGPREAGDDHAALCEDPR